MKPKFSFRQRVGKLDWKSISSLDLDQIINKTNIVELQSILDTLVFSEITPQDINGNSIENSLKLYRLMQIIAEYLLSSQEAQFKMIKDINRKYEKRSSQIEYLKKENISLVENIKIYQRQLSILKRSLSNNEITLVRTQDQSSASNHGIDNKTNKQEEFKHDDNSHKQKNDTKPLESDIIDKVLSYEKESRNYFSNIMDEQRKIFLEEMRLLISSIKDISSAPKQENSNENINILLKDFKFQIENVLEKSLNELKKKDDQIHFRKMPEKDNQVEYALKSSAIDQFEKELLEKERNLNYQVHLLEKKEMKLIQKENEIIEKSKRIDYENSKSNQTSKLANQKAKATSMKLVLNIFSLALTKRKASFFKKWVVFSLNEREKENLDEQSRLLVYSSSKLTESEQKLNAQLEAEKEKFFIAQAKLNSIEREFESNKEKLKDLVDQNNILLEKEKKLANQLKIEKEKNLISQAKLNTIQNKNEKEKQELLDKLKVAESIISEKKDQIIKPIQRSKVDSSVMTSMELEKESPTKNSINNKEVHFITKDKVQQKLLIDPHLRSFLSPNLDESKLMEIAKRKISNRYNAEELTTLAMTSLAKEIKEKISH